MSRKSLANGTNNKSRKIMKTETNIMKKTDFGSMFIVLARAGMAL